MGKLFTLWEGIFTSVSIHYIRLVFRTSRIVKTGCENLLDEDNDEKFVIGFWHGDSYCYYPLLRDRGVYIVTTENRRGNYIDRISRYFGYVPLRVPDESTGGNHLFNVIRTINGARKRNLALSLDGPLGPYHIPKKFSLVTAMASGRRIMPVSMRVKRKIRLTKRWDKYMIPLPFNRIDIRFNEPIRLVRKELETQGKEIIRLLDG